MTDFQQQYALWDEFLREWPITRLRTMTLDEYSKAGEKNTFTYWIEARLEELGSIWGGSAFKFGVYSRKNAGISESDNMRAYSDTHGWYKSLGATAQEAFDNIRGRVVRVAELAYENDLAGIDAIENIGQAYKWKIAFHYQNRQQPMIVNIFKPAMLATFVGGSANQSMAALNQAAMGRKTDELDILEYGRKVWTTWARKNLSVWKMSHGGQEFTASEQQYYLDNHLVAMYRETNGPGSGDKQKGRQGRDFEQAPDGTLFYLCHGNSPQLLGALTTGAEPCPNDDGWIQRGFREIKRAVTSDRYSVSKKNWSPAGNSTFWKVSSGDLSEFESTLLQPYFDISLEELAALSDQGFEYEAGINGSLGEGGQAVIGQKPCCFNRILYGPPGTGKTYLLNKLLSRDYTQTEDQASEAEWCAQFIARHIAELTWWEGIAAALYDLGGRAKVGKLFEHPFIRSIATKKGRNSNVRATLWGTLQHHTVDASETVNIKLRLGAAIFDKTADSVWHFAGDWQEACADLIDIVEAYQAGVPDSDPIKRYSFTTFHQSYGYEDFVEGLRPVLDDSEDGEIRYEIKSGIFKELCERAHSAPDKRFAMVVDEINRGNISKILGELITLIEPDKREGAPEETTVVLPYSREQFSVPANVDLIGTMNTADRSLALLDTALRRRFEFVPLMPDCRDNGADAPLAGLRVTVNGKVIDIPRMLATINERIEALYDRDHCIGHAYLTALRGVTDEAEQLAVLRRVFEMRILPLLEEYFFEDWQKIRLVLADNQKSDAAQFILEGNDHVDDLTRLFGNNHDLDSYATRRRFEIQKKAFDNPDAYIGIYENLLE